MSVEPTGPPEPNAVLLLANVGRLVRERAEAQLRVHGTSLRHLSVLGHLSRRPGLSYSELARRAGITVQSIQATLRQLEADGAVRSHEAGGRGRAAKLHVTAEGRELLGLAMAALRETEQSVLAEVAPGQRAELMSVLLRIAQSLTDRTDG